MGVFFRQTLSIVLLGVFVGVLSVQTPKPTAADSVALLTMADTGTRIGNIVNDVVLDIRAHHPGTPLTHAHVLAIMCQELPSLNASQVNSEGRVEGYMQVIDSTFEGLINGSYAGGACRYVASLENGACADPNSRMTNARCSLELGACLYSYNLMQAGGDAALAYNTYNTGSPNRRANGLADFVAGYNNLTQGVACSKSSYNRPIWGAIMETVSALTGGTFKTDDAQHIAVSASNLTQALTTMVGGGTTNNILGGLLSSLNSSNSSGTTNPIASFLGLGNSPSGSSGTSASGSSGGSGTQSSGVSTNTNTTSDASVIAQTDAIISNAYGDVSYVTPVSAVANSNTEQLLCLPALTQANEPALLAWYCPSGVAASTNFTTDDTSYGLIEITPAETTTYSLTCNARTDTATPTEHTCTITIINPSLALQSPDAVTAGASANIYWSSIDTTACTLTSNTNSTFRRVGISGDIQSHAIYEDTTFTLECETKSGSLISKEVSVGVE